MQTEGEKKLIYDVGVAGGGCGCVACVSFIVVGHALDVCCGMCSQPALLAPPLQVVKAHLMGTPVRAAGLSGNGRGQQQQQHNHQGQALLPLQQQHQAAPAAAAGGAQPRAGGGGLLHQLSHKWKFGVS